MVVFCVMKQIVYTCAWCDKQEAVDPKEDAVPMEWAAIQYTRVHATGENGNILAAQTTCESHACGNCAPGVLDYIEQHPFATAAGHVPERSAQQVLADHAGELLRVNGQMFDGTIRVLGQQNKNLHDRVAELTARNAELEALARTSREP